MSLHFLSYAEAFAALQSRYPDLTEAEVRMWVNGKRSLVALTDHPGKTRSSRLRHPPFRFHWSSSGDQSINALLDCWFPSKQVFRFVPSQRYLTYERLVERWQGRTAKDIHAFITERVNEFRKKPDFGFLDFGAFDPLGRLDLPIEDYIFSLDQAEDKERRWFVGPVELADCSAKLDTWENKEARSAKGKAMRQARKEKHGEAAIKAKAYDLADAFKKRHRSASKKAVADHVCGMLFDEARQCGMLTSRENAPATIGRWLSKRQPSN